MKNATQIPSVLDAALASLMPMGYGSVMGWAIARVHLFAHFSSDEYGCPERDRALYRTRHGTAQHSTARKTPQH